MRRIALVVAVLAGLVSCAPSGGRTAFAEFADIGDLVTRANVQQSDAVVGMVRGIKLVDRGDRWIAQVEIQLDPDIEVNSLTQAIVRSTSLLGEKYVDLVPRGDGDPLEGPIPLSRTGKAPELEEVFSQLGAILQSGALEDLGRLSTAGAMILEGQQVHVGRVLDQTAKLVHSLRTQREALASALADLASASKTLAGGKATLDRALGVSDDALRLVAEQQRELDDLIVRLDRLGKPLGDLTRAHKDDIDAQVRAINAIVPKLREAKDTLEKAVRKLPAFTKLFAEAIPGDYVQLDAFAATLPIGMPATALPLRDFFLEVAR